MKRGLIWLVFICFPFAIIVVVNEFATSSPTHAYQSDYCTRYCHDAACLHTTRKYEARKGSMTALARRIYLGNIDALHRNALGWSYYQINLLVYVFIFPILMAGLLWGAIRKRKI